MNNTKPQNRENADGESRQVEQIVIPRNALLRQYNTPTLCKSCRNIADFHCAWKYQISYDFADGFKCVTDCSGYKEQVV